MQKACIVIPHGCQLIFAARIVRRRGGAVYAYRDLLSERIGFVQSLRKGSGFSRHLFQIQKNIGGNF